MFMKTTNLEEACSMNKHNPRRRSKTVNPRRLILMNKHTLKKEAYSMTKHNPKKEAHSMNKHTLKKEVFL